MVGTENKGLENAMDSYEKIRKTLSGLYEIFKINFNERDFYFQAGMDNLKALNETIVELLSSSFTPREVRMKIRDIQFEEEEMMEHLPL